MLLPTHRNRSWTLHNFRNQALTIHADCTALSRRSLTTRKVWPIVAHGFWGWLGGPSQYELLRHGTFLAHRFGATAYLAAKLGRFCGKLCALTPVKPRAAIARRARMGTQTSFVSSFSVKPAGIGLFDYKSGREMPWFERTLITHPAQRLGSMPHGTYQPAHYTVRAYQRVWQRQGRTLGMFKQLSSVAREYLELVEFGTGAWVLAQAALTEGEHSEDNVTGQLSAGTDLAPCLVSEHVLLTGAVWWGAAAIPLSGAALGWSCAELAYTFDLHPWELEYSVDTDNTPHHVRPLIGIGEDETFGELSLLGHGLVNVLSGEESAVDLIHPDDVTANASAKEQGAYIWGFLFFYFTAASSCGQHVARGPLPGLSPRLASALTQFSHFCLRNRSVAVRADARGALASAWALGYLGRQLASQMPHQHQWSLYHHVNQNLLVTFQTRFCILNRRLRKMVSADQKYRRIFCYVRPLKRTVTTARFIHYFTKFTPLPRYSSRLRHLMFDALVHPETSVLVVAREKQQAAVLTQLLRR